jgi:septal ring factor EnvC (AmiA/AmiB activator)
MEQTIEELGEEITTATSGNLISVGYHLAQLARLQSFIKTAVYPRELVAGQLVLVKEEIQGRKRELGIKAIMKIRKEIAEKRKRIEDNPEEAVEIVKEIKELRTKAEEGATRIKNDEVLKDLRKEKRAVTKDLEEKVRHVREGLAELGYKL